MDVIRFGPQYIPQILASRSLANASIYIGKPDLDPTIAANQVQIYVLQEDGSYLAISQPVTTSAGGVPIYNSSPATLAVNQDYSMKILDSTGSQTYYSALTSVASSSATNFYYPSYTEADQGVTGNSATIYYYLTQIDTTNEATIYLKHDSGSQWTDYVFGTTLDASSYSNVLFVLENGARFSLSSGVTLTLPDKQHVIAPPAYAAFTGTGTVAYSSSTLDLGSGPNYMQIDTDGTLAADSDSRLASQKAIVTYVTASRLLIRDNSRGLVIGNNGSDAWHSIDITASEVSLQNSSNSPYIARSVSLTIDCYSTGANGLDTGSLIANQWYNFFVIYNGSTVAGLASTSTSSPTMPSGYTYKALVGAMITDPADDHFTLFYQIGKRVFYQSPIVVISGSSATTETDINLSGARPPNASSVRLALAGNVIATSSGNAWTYAHLRLVTGVDYFVLHIRVESPSQTAYNDSEVTVPKLSSNLIYLWDTGGGYISSRSLDISVLGFTLA